MLGAGRGGCRAVHESTGRPPSRPRAISEPVKWAPVAGGDAALAQAARRALSVAVAVALVVLPALAASSAAVP
jgi:hypothetical protein